MKTSALAVVFLCSLSVLAQVGKSNTVQMAIPGVKGVLELDVGPTTFETRVRPDGKEVQMRAFGRPDQLAITAFLQRVTFPASAEKCRDEWWPGSKKALRVQRDDLQETVVQDGVARVEYLIPEFQGRKVHQKTVHAYLGSGDLCAEVHLSKSDFNTEEEKLFDDLLSTVRLLPEAPVRQPRLRTRPSPRITAAPIISARVASSISSGTTPPPPIPTRKPSIWKSKSALYPRIISACSLTTLECRMGSVGNCRRRKPHSNTD